MKLYRYSYHGKEHERSNITLLHNAIITYLAPFDLDGDESISSLNADINLVDERC